MISRTFGTVMLSAFLAPAPLFATTGPLAFSVDEKTQSYTIIEQGHPVLTYRFGEVPLPAGIQASHFSKGNTPYDGAYFTDGSRYGGERSDYIYPLYGFHGEPLTADYPKDHPHHRSLWWSWCEVRHNDKIGDLWAVCKIRAYPVKITKMEAGADEAVLQAVNVWRYDDDPAAVVNETITIRASQDRRDAGSPEPRDRCRCQARGVGRRRGNCRSPESRLRRLRRNDGPDESECEGVLDPCRASEPGQMARRRSGIVQRVTDPAAFGDAAWMAIYGKYPAAGIEAPDFTTVMMFESKATPLFPNNFRYYGSTCISLAFPGRTILPLAKGKPLDYRTRFVICEGKTTIEQEKTAWQAYQR